MKQNKEIFFKFLVENNCLFEFIENLQRCRGPLKSMSLHEYIRHEIEKHKNICIIRAFEWRSTKEGFSFWNKINNKWELQKYD